MRPHKMIECMTRTDEGRKVLGGMKDYLDNIKFDAPCFDFGDVANVSQQQINDLYNYAIELLKDDLFNLPFENMTISFRQENFFRDNENQDQTLNTTTFLFDQGDKIGITCVSMFGENFMGLMTGIIEKNYSKNQGDLFFKMRDPYISVFLRSSDDDFLDKVIRVGVPLWSICMMMMLNAKGIEQRITPPPEKLNKRRVAAGKPPIGEIREILINVDGKRYTPSGEAEKGSHASPRLHWRRGHIRRLPSGEITHVRPCLVGSGVSAPVPTYRVKQSA